METGNSILIRLLGIAVFCSFPVLLLSQETSTCAENLKNAQSLFDKGQVETVPGMLRECMKSGFKREEQIAAYKLLIQSYLFEDKLEQADSTMLDFLKSYPEYQLSPTDHSSFVNLYNTFKVKPVLQLSVHLGTNIPFITFIDPGSGSVSGFEPIINYSSKVLNLFASLEGRFEISKKVEINIEAGYSQLNFTKNEDFPNLDGVVFDRNTYNESQSRIEIPVSVNYNLRSFGKLTPYARAGFGPAITLSSMSKKLGLTPTDVNNLIGHTGPDLDRTDSRISTDIFAQIGAGAKYKTRGGYFFAELRSNFGMLRQIINGGNNVDELRYFYYYTDDSFHLNTSNFNLGYTQIFYKPSKRKK
jgi:hypothetical protein